MKRKMKLNSAFMIERRCFPSHCICLFYVYH